MDFDEIKEEIIHQLELRKDHRKRLRVLERHAAKYGIDVRPHVQIEIEELSDSIRKCDQEVDLQKRNFISVARSIIDKCENVLSKEGVVDYKIKWRQSLLMNDVIYTRKGVEELFAHWGFTPQELSIIKFNRSYSLKFIITFLIKIIPQLKQQIAIIESLE